MDIDGFIAILSSTFRPKSTLIPLPLLRLPKVNFRSLCPCLSIEVLVWLDSLVILYPNHALPIARSFNPISTDGNERCFILVRLVSVNWSVADMDIFLAIFISIGVVNDISSEYSARRFSIQVRKYFSVPTLIVLLAFCSILFLASTILLAICSILLLAVCSIFSLAFGAIISLEFGTIVFLAFCTIFLLAIILLFVSL